MCRFLVVVWFILAKLELFQVNRKVTMGLQFTYCNNHYMKNGLWHVSFHCLCVKGDKNASIQEKQTKCPWLFYLMISDLVTCKTVPALKSPMFLTLCG